MLEKDPAFTYQEMSTYCECTGNAVMKNFTVKELMILEGKIAAATTAPPALKLSEPSSDEDSGDADEDLQGVILECIKAMDNGEGVDFESLVRNLAARGFTREQSEAELDSMSDDGLLHEPRFGWFKIVA